MVARHVVDSSASGTAEIVPVSVVIPVYNRAHLIGRAIASVRAQRAVAPAEIVVVDDGSADDTAAIAEARGARVVRHGANRGESSARNTGIEAAVHPWIALLDSDDEWLPGHLETLWRGREGHVLVASSELRCGEDPGQDRLHGTPRARPRLLHTPADLLFPENVVPASAGMLRRRVALDAGGYDESLRLCEDLDFLLRCLEHGTGVVLPDVTCVYHVHAGQLSAEKREMRAWHTRVAERYRGRPWWSERQFSRWRASSSWDDVRQGMGVRAAAPALRSPIAVARLLRWRLQVRRRTARTGRNGGASVALMPRAVAPELPPGTRVVDLRGRSRAGALAYLARRPAGAAVPGARVDALLLAMLRVPVERP